MINREKIFIGVSQVINQPLNLPVVAACRRAVASASFLYIASFNEIFRFLFHPVDSLICVGGRRRNGDAEPSLEATGVGPPTAGCHGLAARTAGLSAETLREKIPHGGLDSWGSFRDVAPGASPGVRVCS
jgi:hypothetical protein